MSDLYIGDPVFEKTGGVKLGKVEQWDDEVLGHFISEHPYLDGFNIELAWKRARPESKVAIGIIKVTNKGSIYVPVIVNNGEMEPLDVAYDSEKRAFPIDENIVQRLMEPKVGTAVPKKQVVYSKGERATLPDMTDVSAKYSSLSEKISISGKQQDSLKEYLRRHPEIIAAMNSRDVMQPLYALLAKKPIEPRTYKYAAQLQKAKIMKEEEQAKAVTAGIFGPFELNTNKGVQKGTSAPLYNSKGKQEGGNNVFWNRSGYLVNDRFPGKTASGTATPSDDVPQGYGLMYHLNGNTSFALLPFMVKGSVEKNGESYLLADTIEGRLKVKKIEKLSFPYRNGDTLYLPKDSKFSKVADRQFGKPLTKRGAVSVKRRLDTFQIQGPNIPEHFKYGVSAKEAARFLKLVYENPADILKTAMNTDITISPTPELPKKKTYKVPERLKVDLIKEASVMPTPEVVDELLSLSFINEDNISHFVDEVQNLELLQNKLADMLVAARLGMDLPKEAIRRALTNVKKVVNGLYELKEQ